MADKQVDVLIVGGGISGIGAACHLTRDLPSRTYHVLERRQTLGGTWDLFRYPGVRSDSDMYTFGFNFRPWNDTRTLADGASIREYVTSTAKEYGVQKHISFGRNVVRASWSSAETQWEVEALDETNGATEVWSCEFLLMCTGYYNYDHGYRPEFAGEDDFAGTIVHPQHWPEDLDYRNKRVVVIGSGATAITLVPAMAEDAAHVTMLQRSPSYILSVPARDKISEGLRRVLSEQIVYRLARSRNIGIQRATYAFAQRRPALMRKLLLAGARRHLGDDADLSHFTPRYDPWDQRLCIIPDGDLFKAVRSGRAEIVTDTIDTFTPDGIRLTSGAELPADIVVAATGLQVRLMGGAEIIVDGARIEISRLLIYKGVLVEDVPNAAAVFGYTNASWTLKADLACEYFVRLIKHMDEHGYAQTVARAPAEERSDISMWSSLKSGYVRRSEDQLPRQGKHAPWVMLNNYRRDAPMLRSGPIEDGILQFSRASTRRNPHKVVAQRD